MQLSPTTLPPALPQGGRDPRQGLGTDGDLLPLPAGALNAPELLELVYEGRKCVDGVIVKKITRRLAA
jgi:hypothetical protein